MGAAFVSQMISHICIVVVLMPDATGIAVASCCGLNEVSIQLQGESEVLSA